MARIFNVATWVLFVLIMIFMVTQPIDINTHFVTAMLVAAVIAILKLQSDQRLEVVVQSVSWQLRHALPSAISPRATRSARLAAASPPTASAPPWSSTTRSTSTTR